MSAVKSWSEITEMSIETGKLQVALNISKILNDWNGHNDTEIINEIKDYVDSVWKEFDNEQSLRNDSSD